MPLESVLTAYHIGGRIGWRALAEEARPEERDELDRFAEDVMAYIQAVTGAVASAYMEEQQHIYGEQRGARRTLTEALLAGPRNAAGGWPPVTQARRAGVQLAHGYLTLARRFEPSDDEQAAGVSGAVAGRRRRGMGPWLGGGSGRGRRGARRAGPRPAAGTISRGVPSGRSAARVRRHAPHGYREAADGGLAPIDDRPDLVETLEQWYAADFDRRGAAARCFREGVP